MYRIKTSERSINDIETWIDAKIALFELEVSFKQLFLISFLSERIMDRLSKLTSLLKHISYQRSLTSKHDLVLA